MSRRAMHEQLLAALQAEEPVADVPLPSLDTSALPAPLVRSRRAPATARSEHGLVSTDLAGKLEHLSGRALDRLDDLLDLDIADDEHEKFGEKVRALNAATKTVLQTQVRVDEHRLKTRALDVLPELLEAIKQEEARRTLAQ
jgi:hypothetical protein